MTEGTILRRVPSIRDNYWPSEEPVSLARTLLKLAENDLRALCKGEPSRRQVRDGTASLGWILARGCPAHVLTFADCCDIEGANPGRVFEGFMELVHQIPRNVLVRMRALL